MEKANRHQATERQSAKEIHIVSESLGNISFFPSSLMLLVGMKFNLIKIDL
jgi:hypothetical protein